MSPEVLKEFKKLLSRHHSPGPILEIGATSETTLAQLPELAKHPQLISINADVTACHSGIRHLSSHDLSEFPDGYFSMVLCNSVWEHDLFFWQSLQEMTRVCQSQGILILGVPSFGDMQAWQKGLGLKKYLLRRLLPRYFEAVSITLGIHHYPDDYYRFSASAIQKLLQQNWRILEQIECMQPPRVITCAQKL